MITTFYCRAFSTEKHFRPPSRKAPPRIGEMERILDLIELHYSGNQENTFGEVFTNPSFFDKYQEQVSKQNQPARSPDRLRATIRYLFLQGYLAKSYSGIKDATEWYVCAEGIPVPLSPDAPFVPGTEPEEFKPDEDKWAAMIKLSENPNEPIKPAGEIDFIALLNKGKDEQDSSE